MNAFVTTAIEDLRSTSWFSRVGTGNSDLVKNIRTWDDAVRYCSSVEYGNICLDAANTLRERVLSVSRDRYHLWNSYVDECKPTIEEIANTAVSGVDLRGTDLKAVLSQVQWDLLHLLLEAEYADIVPPGFYAGTAYWYTIGHFPCGMEEEGGGICQHR